jgi:hypothetical protein
LAQRLNQGFRTIPRNHRSLSVWLQTPCIAPCENPFNVTATLVFASDAFFSTLQIPFVAGAPFGRDDRREGVQTAIVSESVTRALFGGESAIGRTGRMGTNPRNSLRSVARDAILSAPQNENTPVVYVNYWQIRSCALLRPS